MRFTRRRPDAQHIALAAVLVTATSASLVSCVVEERTLAPTEDSLDAATPPEPATNDASIPTEAGTDVAVDAPAPQVTCAGDAPCVVGLRAPAEHWWNVDLNAPNGVLPTLSETFCALLSSGKVACWGDGKSGQLGRIPKNATAIGEPAFVPNLDDAVDLDRGCAVRANARSVCWGQFVSPESDTGATEETFPGIRTLAIPSAKRIRMANDIGCALLTDDRVSCWGLSRDSGQMQYAQGTTSAGGVFGPAVVPLASNQVPVDVVLGSPTIEVSYRDGTVATRGGATFVLLKDGSALSWGGNLSLGRLSSFRPDPIPTAIDVAEVAGMSAAGSSTCAVANDDVYCWGHLEPTLTRMGIYGAVNVATAGPVPFGRGCAVTRRGDVYCWGANDFGQAGDGTDTLARVPVKVGGLPKPAVLVEVTANSSCAVLVDGEVDCWGDASLGQLGRFVPLGNSFGPLKVTFPEAP